MNTLAIQQVAKELRENIRDKIENKLTEKLHVHVKYAIRKEEIKALKKSKHFQDELEKALNEDPLYQDCSSVNTEPGSLLLEYYKKDEELYDKFFIEGICKESLLEAVSRFKEEEEQKAANELMQSMNMGKLIDQAVDELESEIIHGIERHLLYDYLEQRGTYNPFSNFTHEPEDVTIDNYEEFIEAFECLDEEELLSMADYNEQCFNSGIWEHILKIHPEIGKTFPLIDVYDCFEEEFSEGEHDLSDRIRGYFTEEKLSELIFQNQYLKNEFKAVRELREGVLKKIPNRLPDLFPIARNRKRKFILHLGPTNSGKTYDAVEALKKAEKGIYLAPLRLLAFEQHQKLNEEGYPCSLYTGEEHKIIENARLQSSTVEIADLMEHYDVVVLDEAQMINDTDRGWAWTKVLLGINADEIHVCAAPYAEDIIVQTIKECGDEYQIMKHHRQTPLSMDKEKFKLQKTYIQKGDAFIVFSRRAVHAIARELQDMGKRCSVIYGNLPYDVRQEEARRFRDGETDVVVSTDAIGMGMNLPIKRIVFLEVKKYDGYTTRPLKPEEATQIAGRAGRMGLYEEGRWTVLGDKMFIKRIMDKKIPQITEARVGLPNTLITVNGKLSDIITRWKEISLPEGYVHASLDHEKKLCNILENYTNNKELIYEFITIPFDDYNETLMVMWRTAFNLIQKHKKISISSLSVPSFNDGISLDKAEELYKLYDLTYSLLERFSKDKNEVREILEMKHDLSMKIAELLKESKLPHRKCKYCGKKLAWNYPYGMCNSCHDIYYPPRYNYDYDEYWF